MVSRPAEGEDSAPGRLGTPKISGILSESASHVQPAGTALYALAGVIRISTLFFVARRLRMTRPMKSGTARGYLRR